MDLWKNTLYVWVNILIAASWGEEEKKKEVMERNLIFVSVYKGSLKNNLKENKDKILDLETFCN